MSGDSSAYRLAVVGAGRVRGQIAVAACPGRAGKMLLPSNSRWCLHRDVATLRHWGAEALVTLLEKSEMLSMRLGELPALLAAHGIAWYHVPLGEGNLPDVRFEGAWQPVSWRLRSVLWRGGRVALHCADGRSRAPLVTAKLLVELGCPLRDALNRVRSVRPGVLACADELEFLQGQNPGESYFVPRAGAAPLPVPAADEGAEVPEVHNPNQLDLLRAS
jgi:protein-tyrosine phosphatase